MDNIYNNILMKGLLAIQRFIIMFATIGTTLIVGGACILRAVGINFIGFEEILIIVVFWLYMMGCAYGSYEKSQITADILEVMLPETYFKDMLRIARTIITFALGAVFAYWGFMLLMWAAQMDTRTPVFRIPVVVGQSSIFVGLVLVTFYNLIHMIDEIKSISGKRRNDSSIKRAVINEAKED